MTKDNGYIWITDEVDSSNFSMVAPRRRCHAKPTVGCKSCGKEMNNKIVNERIIQVAVAWGGATARNKIDSDIDSDDKSGQKEFNLCCNGGGLMAAGLAAEDELYEGKNYNLDAFEGDFSLTISKDGEITVNGLKAEK